MDVQNCNAVFCYAYFSYEPQDENFAGFTINLYDENLLAYTTYDIDRNATGESVFRVPPEIVAGYYRMLDYAMPWLNHVPDRISLRDEPLKEYSFGFDGMQLLRVEDMEELVGQGFGNFRCHYARELYGFLENMSALLGKYGFKLVPQYFGWIRDVVEEITPRQGPDVLMQA